ncbi:MAG TPA: DUF2194 domain-containing protein [Flavobacterium sp.]|jgi:hypothetical protein
MKKSYAKMIFRACRAIALALMLTAAGCGKMDNFDGEDFSFFDEDKKELAELRTYSLPEMSNEPLVEFIVDDVVKLSSDYEKNIRKTCDYAKLPYRAQHLSQWNNAPQIASSTRALCIFDTKKLSPASINKLMEFVAGGGTLVFPAAIEDRRLAFLMGFKPDAEFETDITSKGIKFVTPVLPSLQDADFNEEALHYGYAAQNFSKNIHILASALNNPDFPVMLENPIGKGRVILFNTSMIFEKIDRGLIFAAVLKGIEGVPYPIANTSTIFLDDFPSPLYDIKQEPIKSEMDLNITDFVRTVWWPDMQSLAKKYNISYSAMIAFDYKNFVNPPFVFDQWDKNKLKANKKIEPVSDWLVKDVKKKGHELALHGYNHVSLKKTLWPNQEFIGTALKAVQKKWEVSNFGDFPTTYVPPSNIIDKEGVALLKKSMPSLKYMCSLYLGERQEGGDREFDFDPYQKDFFDYPRISDGFYLSKEKKYSQQSMYLYTGIWTHFVHPDDIYQIANPYSPTAGDYDLRNDRGLGWKKTKGKNIGLFTEFNDYLRQMTMTFPQMRFLNANDGGSVVNDWRASMFKHSRSEGRYTVAELSSDESLSDKQYWFVFGSAANASKVEGQLRNEAVIYSKTPLLDGFLFMAYTNKPKLTLRDLKYEGPAQNLNVQKARKKVQQDYKRYLASVAKFLSGGYEEGWVDDSEQKFRLELQTLRTKMLADTKIDSVTWNKYAKYMVWEDRGDEVWKMLEEYCVKHPLPQNIMYSKELDKIIEYPNEITREKWLSAQLLVTPNDKDLLNSYIAAYHTPENQEKIRTALVNLLKVDTSFDTWMQYIQHLLVYDPPAALEELKDKQPKEEYKVMATDVAWLYADNLQYQKAYDWSVLSGEVDFASKMSWLLELRSYKVLEEEYKKHIVNNPTDYKAMAEMSGVYHELGRFRDAWVLADSLPEIPEKDALRITLNKDVVYVEPELQQDLLENFPGLFLPEVKAELTKVFRKDKGNFIALNSAAETNKDDPSAFKNVLSYNFYDKKENLHSIAGTYSTMYKVDLKLKDLDNVTHAIGGIQYQFNNKKSDKLQYWTRGRVEYSNYERFYYQFGIGANHSKEKHYKSAEFKIFPAETGPAHSKRIYRMQLNLYYDAYFLKYLNGSISAEGNYYMASKQPTSIATDDTYEGSLTGKLLLDDGKDKKSRFLPFVEGSFTQASVGEADFDLATGYPYWIIDERFYGGGGLGWKFGLSEDDFRARVEASYFFDSYSDNFQRYTGEVAYQLFDFTMITASFEVYAQSKFYSNILQFGVKYNLKKRKKK